MENFRNYYFLVALLTTSQVLCRNLVADETIVGGSELVDQEQYGAITLQYTPVGWDKEELNLNILEQNLDYLDAAFVNAKGRDLLVFPEYALTSLLVKENREAAYNVSQIVPHVGNIMCEANSTLGNDYLAVSRLSCLAKRLQITLVANLVEKVICKATEVNQPCGADGVLLYNTNVAFDQDGKLLAKYRKFNLVEESAFNKTDAAEAVKFNTKFGVTFGLVTGHDLLFHSPASELINKHQVTNFAHPTAWVNNLPFKTGTQIQMGWSHTMGVNLVSSSYLHVEKGYSGAGIYRKDGTYRTAIGLETGGDPIIDFHDQEPQDLSNFFTDSDSLLANYSTTLINNETTLAETCFEDFCCYLNFEADFGNEEIFFQLIAFNGTDEDGVVVQACGLVACGGPEVLTCGDGISSASYATRISFNALKLRGTFSSSEVIPSTLKSESALPFSFKSTLAKQQLTKGWQVAIEINEPVKVRTFALYSHDFHVVVGGNNAATAWIPCFILLHFAVLTLRLIV
ncbi:pantetheinase-like [Neocloeon triangulifer]|uniref:pantetheinase-like n=1 Tax=Neocloeon triangulifer TaxID=2078957 RepID=UPI00286EE9D4|nr:pantetheinase-like [Neocloeon triangulifer]